MRVRDNQLPTKPHILSTMKDALTRRKFLATTTGALITMPAILNAEPQDPKPPLPDDLVKKFVGAAHGKFQDVKDLLAETPSLLNATWDWKNGDFETAIGGAGHTGNREIAEYLIAQGARTDLFIHTMLGHIDIVKPILIRYPEMINCKGPHGIPLIRHAEAGGEAAKELLEFLKTLQKLENEQ
ncbi:MAG: ankyrin repeat domain-containing protein [Fimbriimonadaceae bacterium]